MLASGHRTGSGGWHGPGLGLYWASDPWSTVYGTYRSLYTGNPEIRRGVQKTSRVGSIRCVKRTTAATTPMVTAYALKMRSVAARTQRPKIRSDRDGR